MRRSLVLLVVLVAACSGSSEVSTTTSQPSPSATASPQTLIPGGLVPVDAATLVPFEDASAVLVGDSHSGVVSTSGRWAGIRSEKSGSQGTSVSIVDLNSMLVVADQTGSGEGLRIGDDGSAVWFQDGRLNQLEITSESTSFDSPAVPAYFTDTLTILSDGRLAYLAGPDEELGPVSVVVVGGDEPVVHVVDRIESGPLPPDDPRAADLENLVPSVAWDAANNQAFVISPDEDALVVVDLETGAATEHDFTTGASPDEQIARRDSYVTSDGSTLFVATGILPTSSDEGVAPTTTRQLVSVDTSDWSSRLISASADAIYPSPDDTVIATTGAGTRSDDESQELPQSPVFLVDTKTAEPIVGFEGRSGVIVDIQFSNDGAEMYVVSEGPDGTNIDIVDVAGEQLAGSLGFARISLIGEAGLLAFHLSD